MCGYIFMCVCVCVFLNARLYHINLVTEKDYFLCIGHIHFQPKIAFKSEPRLPFLPVLCAIHLYA